MVRVSTALFTPPRSDDPFPPKPTQCQRTSEQSVSKPAQRRPCPGGRFQGRLDSAGAASQVPGIVRVLLHGGLGRVVEGARAVVDPQRVAAADVDTGGNVQGTLP